MTKIKLRQKFPHLEYIHVIPFLLFRRVKSHIANWWDKKIVDPDPQKRYILQKNLSALKPKYTDVNFTCETGTTINEWVADGWPKGPYTQQNGVLPAVLNGDIITAHLKPSGKRLQPRKHRKVSENESISDSASSLNIDYLTLQRGHQYFMELYIPGEYVCFCCKEGQTWSKAICYHSQKK